MARYKQAEFARLCGIQDTSIPAYIKRNKIVVDGGYIDDENLINYSFMKSCFDKKSLEKHKQPDNATGTIQEQNGISVKKTQNDNSLDLYDLEKKKKQLGLLKIEEETELLRKRNMKIDGESVPTDIVRTIFSDYGKNIVKSFQAAAENWLTRLSKTKGLSNTELANFRQELTLSINDAVDRAQEESKRGINSIVGDYTKKRGVGEHD